MRLQSQTWLSNFHFHFSYVLLDLYLFYLGVNVNDDMRILFCFLKFFVMLLSMRDLSSSTREWTHTPLQWKAGSLSPWTTGKSLILFFISNSKCSLLEYRKWKWEATQSCPTLCGHMGCIQARMWDWVAFPLSRGSSQPRDWTQVSCIAGRFFTSWATREAQGI